MGQVRNIFHGGVTYSSRGEVRTFAFRTRALAGYVHTLLWRRQLWQRRPPSHYARISGEFERQVHGRLHLDLALSTLNAK